MRNPEKYYRAEHVKHSIADEWGDHSYTSHSVRILEYSVDKHTKCGVWLFLPLDNRKWISNSAQKGFARPSKEEALQDLAYRKKKQIRIYQARIKAAEQILRACGENLLPSN